MYYRNAAKKYDAKDRIRLLMDEGAKVPISDNVSGESSFDLPEWFDEEKYKRGQKFFYSYIFGMLLSKLCGLLTILAIPSILKLLIHTNMSSKPLTAYRRYTATILHMCMWYDTDLKPDSKFWLSISDVKSRHSSASRKGCKAGLGKISQRDMAYTQFGFMGYILANPKLLGVQGATKEELEGFIHLWRVIGHLMGIEDRFNICAGSVEDTTELCQLMVKKVFRPALQNMSNDFTRMSKVLLDGMLVFNPFLDHATFLIFIFKLCGMSIKEISNNNTTDIIITPYTKFVLWLLSVQMYFYQFYLGRWYLNLQETLSLWLLQHFPFIAYFKFGYQNSHVVIVRNNNNF